MTYFTNMIIMPNDNVNNINKYNIKDSNNKVDDDE